MREYIFVQDHMKRWESVAIVEQLSIKYCITLKEARRTDTKRERERERDRVCVCLCWGAQRVRQEI
jgi:hypothetical protein